MFKVIRIPTKFSRTIKRFSDKDKAKLLDSLISIGDGEQIQIPDTILGDTISLIYGEWMNMEAKNGIKKEDSLILPSMSANDSASMSEARVEYNKIKENIVEDKKEYGELKNVKLTQDEYDKLIEGYGDILIYNYITRLDLYIATKSPKYKSHYAVILTWLNKEGAVKGAKNESIKILSKEEGISLYERQRKERRARQGLSED